MVGKLLLQQHLKELANDVTSGGSGYQGTQPTPGQQEFWNLNFKNQPN